MPPLYPRYGLKHVFFHNNLIMNHYGMVFPVCPYACLGILVVDNFSGSRLFSFRGYLWEVISGFSKIMISILNPLENKCYFMLLGAMKLVDVQLPFQQASQLCLLQLVDDYKTKIRGSQEIPRGLLLPPRDFSSTKSK